MAKAGYFVSRWKAALGPRRKIVGRSHCRSGRLTADRPLEGRGAVLSEVERIRAGMMIAALTLLAGGYAAEP
jgi:hypothetical protein